jgi:glycosyltransferase involved in cell wall biosynthesis
MAQRVLYIEGNTDGTVGGSYFVLCDLVNALDRSQYEPIVGFHRDNYLVEKLRTGGTEVVVFPAHAPLRFKASWMNTLLAPLKKAINFHRGVVVPTLAHARFLRARRIDLLNLNNSITRNHPWMLAALLTGTTCVTHEMGINHRYSRLSRFLGRRLARVVCVSHAVRNAMRKCGVDFPNITVIHCGIDLTRYVLKDSPQTLRRKHGIPDDAPVVGVVGNIRQWKGQETIVRAVALLARAFPALKCLLVGACSESDRPFQQHLERLCDELGVTGNVIFAGFQTNAIDYMELMDVVVHTSTHPEPFGIVTLEAMSRSKPLVSTTIGGPAEVVVNGETGLLIEPGDPQKLASAIESLLKDPERAREMGRKGRQRLLDKFTLQQNLAKTMQVYEQALSHSPSCAAASP